MESSDIVTTAASNSLTVAASTFAAFALRSSLTPLANPIPKKAQIDVTRPHKNYVPEKPPHLLSHFPLGRSLPVLSPNRESAFGRLD